MSKHFSLNTAYVLSRAVCYRCNLGAASFRNRPSNPFAPLSKGDFGFAPSDERHRWTLSGAFDLPWGLQIAPVLQLASARPYDPLSSVDLLGFGQSAAARPALVPLSNPYDFTTYAGIDPTTAQALIAFGQARTSKFDSLRGDKFFQFDARVSKTFTFAEKYNLKLISQFFDLTNRANFGATFCGLLARSHHFFL